MQSWIVNLAHPITSHPRSLLASTTKVVICGPSEWSHLCFFQVKPHSMQTTRQLCFARSKVATMSSSTKTGIRSLVMPKGSLRPWLSQTQKRDWRWNKLWPTLGLQACMILVSLLTQQVLRSSPASRSLVLQNGSGWWFWWCWFSWLTLRFWKKTDEPSIASTLTTLERWAKLRCSKQSVTSTINFTTYFCPQQMSRTSSESSILATMKTSLTRSS